MSSLIKADINPDCLKWAREEAGYDSSEIARELKITLKRYQDWEEKGEKIPLGKLKELSKKYKKQLAVFFLPQAPQKSTPPKDFRNLTIKGTRLSKDVVLAFRRTERYRELALEIQGVEYWATRYQWESGRREIASNNLLHSETMNWLRSILKISLQDQIDSQNYFYAYKKWRTSIENNLGIFVFQFPMPMNQVQGFSYRNFFPYAIVVNSKHSNAGKIFTLFHELAHILLKDAGMCNPDLSDDAKQSVEYLCNEFAGRFLVPDENVIPAMDNSELLHYSNVFKVSREVYLRRMFSHNYLTKPEFFNQLKSLREEVKPVTRDSKGGPSRNVVSKSQRGELFFNMILDAAHRNQISFNRASDALGIGTNYLISGV